MAFFPCIRFEDQIQMGFRGTMNQQQKWSDEKKLEYDLKLHNELTYLYSIITKMAIVFIKNNQKLIIENPYSTTHYLTKYWAIKSSIIDMDRTKNGDYYKKPTQYWFINCEPKNNIIIEPIYPIKHKGVVNTSNKVERSLIHPQYANRFIRTYIL